MQQQQKKKFSLGCASLFLVVALSMFIGVLVGMNAVNRGSLDQASEQTTADTIQAYQSTQSTLVSPASTVTWTMTHSFTGDGNNNTASFLVGDLWKIQWSCGTGSTSENVIINVYDANSGQPIELAAINTICNMGNTSGETIERQAGNMYLNIESEGGWTVKVMEEQ